MTPILFLILLLQFKHLICDFSLQNEFILKNKYQYGHPGGLVHVGVHAIGTGIAFLVMGGVSLGILVAILAMEAVVHYHIDWGKANINKRLQLTEKDGFFWTMIGIDQFLHQATYVAIAAYWATTL